MTFPISPTVRHVVVLLALLPLAACGEGGVLEPLFRPVAAVEVAPASDSLDVGKTRLFTATLRDAEGNPLENRPVRWSSSAPSVARVDSAGEVTAVGAGEALIAAVSEGKQGAARVVVVPSVASLDVTPREVPEGAGVRLHAVLRDAAGNFLPARSYTMTSQNPEILALDRQGNALGRKQGTASVTITSEGKSATVTVAVTAPRVVSVALRPQVALAAVGVSRALGVILTGNNGKWIEAPVQWSSTDPAVATVSPAGEVTGVREGSTSIVATSEGKADTIPLTVIRYPAPLSFTSLEAGGERACGLTPEGAAYCWGNDRGGLLGTDVPTERTPIWYGTHWGPLFRLSALPVPVAGGVRFASLARNFGTDESCALGQEGRVYCWNVSAGIAPVPGDVRFTQLAMGARHTCGLTAGGAVHCRGDNSFGQLGNGSTEWSNTWVQVAGGQTFASVVASLNHTCALTESGAAYCWGYGSWGALGNGSTQHQTTPVAVAGGLAFTALTAGGGGSMGFTCGLTREGAVHCWGRHPGMVLRGGYALAPERVESPVAFASLSAGAEHMCGLTTGGAAYCWGKGLSGGLGNGSVQNQGTPVQVQQGGLSFVSISAGYAYTCARTAERVVYCWGMNQSGQTGQGDVTRDTYTPARVLGQK